MNVRGLLGWSFAVLLTVPTAEAATPLDKIDQAQVEGQLSPDEAVLLKVQVLKGAKNLPAEFRSDHPLPERCGTQVTLEVFENWNSYSPSTQSVLRETLARPAQQKSLVSPDGLFKIHYDTTGVNAVPLDDEDFSGAPDYVENLARYADSSHQMEVLHLGYRPPPFDADSLYDIYTQEIDYYGYAQPENPGPQPWNDATSFIVVHRNFVGFPPNYDPDGHQKGAMKVTVGHEYHHAIQFAYNVGLQNRLWFMEVTSTWMEEMVFDPVDDNYNYLPTFFLDPQTPLTNTGIHMYGSFIWNQYLAQNFGPDLVRQTWEENISFTAVSALDRVLQNHGSTIGTEFTRFALWNFYTGSRDDGRHYEEGQFYPEMVLQLNGNSPTISGRSQSIPPLAAHYESFHSDSAVEKVRLTFVGRNSSVWGAHVLFHRPPAVTLAHAFNLNSNYRGDTTLFGPDSFPQVVLLASQIKTSQLNSLEYFDYSYWAIPLFIIGDLNEDLLVNPDDIVYMMNLVFLGLPPLENHPEAADLNCSGSFSPADLVALLRLVFLSQSPSC
jgi:hypothetical protein